MRTSLSGSLVPLLLVPALSWVPSQPLHALSVQVPESGAAVEEGIPVLNQEVIERCGACHQVDDGGRMGRISFMRKTPEGWQRSLLRMISLQGVELEPEAARRIVRYLSNEHGLAPEELRPAFWEVERRVVPNEAPNEIIRETCTACHSVGRVLTQRRSGEEWRLLTETHRAYYPLVDNQVYRDGEGTPDDPYPVDEALKYLREALPVETPEWIEWVAASRAPRLGGTWVLSGREVGRGSIYGTLEISPVAGSDGEFTTRATYMYARDGASVTREGEVLVYMNHQWRGRSQEVQASGPRSPGAAGELREVMFVEPDWSEAYGRWFTGAYDELGLDVRLRRVGADPVLAGVYPEAVRRVAATVELRVYGANLPVELDPEEVDLGPGIRVEGVSESTPGSFVVQASVEPDAAVGSRHLRLGHVTLRDALVVYDRVARIAIEPEMGMARVGGASLPKQYERFQAIAFGAGTDGEPGTADDPRLGLVDVDWGLEEYPVSFDDDDVEFVGEIDRTGFFTPAEDGPNPARSGDRNNVGDVWVTATYDPGTGGQAPLEARGQLVVTVPLYLRWELSPITVEPEDDR